MRIMAHVSKDRELIAFFNSGRDIHALVAAKWKSRVLSKLIPNSDLSLDVPFSSDLVRLFCALGNSSIPFLP